jgi:hypothetical protein
VEGHSTRHTAVAVEFGEFLDDVTPALIDSSLAKPLLHDGADVFDGVAAGVWRVLRRTNVVRRAACGVAAPVARAQPRAAVRLVVVVVALLLPPYELRTKWLRLLATVDHVICIPMPVVCIVATNKLLLT